MEGYFHCQKNSGRWWMLVSTNGALLVCGGVRVDQSLVFYLVYCKSFFVLLSPLCGHCVVCPSSIYGIWLPPMVSSNSPCNRPLMATTCIRNIGVRLLHDGINRI
jgi:hypothetical protein